MWGGGVSRAEYTCRAYSLAAPHPQPNRIRLDQGTPRRDQDTSGEGHFLPLVTTSQLAMHSCNKGAVGQRGLLCLGWALVYTAQLSALCHTSWRWEPCAPNPWWCPLKYILCVCTLVNLDIYSSEIIFLHRSFKGIIFRVSENGTSVQKDVFWLE